MGWVIGAGRAVASYYGTFPVPRVAVLIHVGGRGAVSGGRTEGRGEPSIRIRVGDDASARDLSDSWILVHEMVHLAFPTSRTSHAWLEEGLATYVEPLVRARAGLAPADEIWTWLVRGIPKGLASARGVSLDEARGHSATYWGGAAFCFLADVEIRKRTNNRFSLDDALRGIVRAGGEVTRSWPIEKVLSEGDRATGVPVLTELYERMGKAPMPEKVDLADLEAPGRGLRGRADCLRRRGAALGRAARDHDRLLITPAAGGPRGLRALDGRRGLAQSVRRYAQEPHGPRAGLRLLEQRDRPPTIARRRVSAGSAWRCA